MSVIRVVGKTTFFSSRKNKDFFVLHVAMKKDSVEGMAVEQKFVSSEIFDKAYVDGLYRIQYGCNDFGQAVIDDLIEVKAN